MLGADFMALEPLGFSGEDFFITDGDIDPTTSASQIVNPPQPSIWKLYNESIKRESEIDTKKRVKNFKWRIEHGNTLISWHTAHMRRRQAVTSINVPVPTPSFDFAARKRLTVPRPHQLKPTTASQSLDPSDFTLDPLNASFGLDDNSFQLDNIPLAFNALEDPISAPRNAFSGVGPHINMHTNNDLELPAHTPEPIRDLLYRDERIPMQDSLAYQQNQHLDTGPHYPYQPDANHSLPITSASNVYNLPSTNNSPAFDSTMVGSSTGAISSQNWSNSSRRPELYTSPNVHQVSSAVSKQNRKKKQFQSAELVFGDLNPGSAGADSRIPHFDMHELLPNDLMALDSPIPVDDTYEVNGEQFKGFDLDFWRNLPTPDSRRRNRAPVSRSSVVSLTSLPGSSAVSRAGSAGAFDTGDETDENSLFNSPVPINSRESSTQMETAARTAPTRPVSDKPRGRTQEDLQCDNCKTFNTPLWRRDDNQNPLCNACGLFYKLHGTNRPLKLKTDVIKRRNRQLEEIPVRRRRRRAPKSRQVRLEERPGPSKPIKISPKPSESPSSETSGQSPHNLPLESPSGESQFQSSPSGAQF